MPRSRDKKVPIRATDLGLINNLATDQMLYRSTPVSNSAHPTVTELL